jgi:predicted ribosome quality control (RQC) complex YloA/Tae2 family protein
MFADDNSAYRRVARREAEVQAQKERRREEIMATLRRLREEAQDEEFQRAQERARRHADLLARYPPVTIR